MCCQREDGVTMLAELQATPADTTVPHLTEEEARASARAVVNLFDRWVLTDDQACELLGGLAPRTWARWKKGDVGRVERDRATRLSLLLGIHKGLRYMFGTDLPRVYAWIKAPNAAFGGASALDVMMGGRMTDLARVRRYLNAERSGR